MTKEEKAAKMRAYYTANSERIKARNAAWYAANSERHKNLCSAYYAANSEKIRAVSKAYYDANPEKLKARRVAHRVASPVYNRRHKYGVSPDCFQLMLAVQKNACGICKEIFSKQPHVDHCHKTGEVRGLLCGSCNRALGLLKDSQDLLENAKEYLRE